MALRRTIDLYASLLTVLLLFHLSRQDSGAARLPHCHTQQHNTVNAAAKVGISDRGRVGGLNACHAQDVSETSAVTVIGAVKGTTAADPAAGIHCAIVPCSTIAPAAAETSRHLLQQQILLYGNQSDASSATVPGAVPAAAKALPAYRAGCTARPAFRMFVPDSVQSTQSHITIVLQLVQPSATLWQLLNTTTCGSAYSCFITADPPGEVAADSLEVSEAEGVGRISIKLPKVGSVVVASSLELELKADPCSVYGTSANISVPIYAGAPRGVLQTLTAPTLTNSTFTVEADFGREISAFDQSRILLNNMSGISSIVRTNHTSFVLFCDALAEKTAKLQLQDGSFISSTYVGGNATNVLAVHIPGLQEILPFYATAAQTILPIALGISGFACAVAIFAIPGTPLASCAPSLIRTLSHLQFLAASAGISRAVGHEGFSGSYAAAAGRLSWALLDWFPSTAVQAINKDWVQLLAVAPASENITWAPAAPDGTMLDSWLADMQNISALITAYDVSSSTAQQQQLQQLGIATRAAAPQLPLVVNIPPHLQTLAVSAWSGLISCCEVAVCLLIAAVLVHVLMSVIGGGSWRAPVKSNSVIRVAPATVQFPTLLIVALLLTLPALLHWVGCLIAAKQQFWIVFAGVISVGAVAGTLYVWVLQKLLTTAQTALLPPSTASGTAAGQATAASSEIELTLDGGQTRYIKAAGQEHQQHTRRSKDVSMLQQEYPGEVVTVVRNSRSHNGQRAQLQQWTTGHPIAEAASAVSPSVHEAADADDAAESELNSSNRAGSATLLEAVASTLQEYQQRLAQFRRSKAYLSVSGRSWSVQQQQQVQEFAQNVNAVPSLASEDEPVVDELQAEAGAQPLNNHTQQQQHGRDRSTSEQGCGSNTSRPLAEASELPNSTVDEDVERLQQEEVLREQQEARRRAKVRKQLRQQRMRPDAVIQPRPLPPGPPELTAAEQPFQALGYVAAASAAGSVQQTALPRRSGNVYDSWGVSAFQQQQQGASRVSSKAGTTAGAPAPAVAAAAAPGELDGMLARCMASCGLLQGLGSQVHLGNALVEQRLRYMARYGVLLWDMTGSVGTTNPRDEARLIAGTSRAALLVANILFAMLAGICCVLYGSIGPLGVFEPQVWGITLVQIIWLVYVVGLNPFCEVLVTTVEVFVTSGQVLIVVCALMGIVQGDAVMAKTRIVSLCCLAGMVLFMTVVECLRALMLAVSAWYGMRQGGRRKKRVVALV